ncbi:uncharacterized protein LOC111056023 isoform X2 [Nilaparvata lugens]|uniref:uncharacterized protein LOC111056023 isoform X2 n=1 Tax=Nilaparvata lugens TaxID=108931 RepID=UPI00193D8BAE|nr:uncharacterized protein LOC111056023 isoform X2 [Nilaparvata lugens]
MPYSITQNDNFFNHSYTFSVTVLIFLAFFYQCNAFNRCGQREKETQKYHLVQPCSSSKMNILASSNANSLQKCEMLAKQNKGLAFSYLSEGSISGNYGGEEYYDDNEDESTCRVFDCPEFESTLALQPVSGHHYYSLYARPMANTNVTCVPGIGIFILHNESRNHSEAVQLCREEGGVLASPLSEKRSMYLGHLIASTGKSGVSDKWYVGLDDIQMEGTFVSSTGELLKCVQFRAWAPGEPHSRKDDDCVVINPRFTWQVVPCSKKLPFVCEILPGGPLHICSANSSLASRKECLDNHINRTEYFEYNSKCKLPPGYLMNLTEMLEKVETSITKVDLA